MERTPQTVLIRCMLSPELMCGALLVLSIRKCSVSSFRRRRCNEKLRFHLISRKKKNAEKEQASCFGRASQEIEEVSFLDPIRIHP